MRKGKINIDKLMLFLPMVCDKGFFQAFEEFCIETLRGDLCLINSTYAKWVKNRLPYRHFKKTDSEKLFEKNLKIDSVLVLDIKNNGMKTPIYIFQNNKHNDMGVFEIDGYHRLVICKVLGNTMVDYECGVGLYEVFFQRIKKHIKGLSKVDFY